MTTSIEEVQEDNESIADSGPNTSLTGPSSSTSTSDRVEVEALKPRKKKPNTAAEVFAEPMAAYFKSLTHKSETEVHPIMSYFKGRLRGALKWMW